MSHQIKLTKSDILEDNKLKKAIMNVAQPVIDSYGPAGGNTFLFHPEHPLLPTRDGITILNQNKPSDPLEQFAKKLLANASEETDILVGDGTTTTVIITAYLVDGVLDLLSKGYEGKILYAELNGLRSTILEYLQQQKIEVLDTDKEVVENLAYIASRDSKVSSLIGEMFEKMGRECQKEIQQHLKPEDEIEMINGVRFEADLISESFIDDESEQSTTLHNPLILIADKDIKHIEEITSPDDTKGITKILKETGKDSLVIICHDVKDKAYETLKRNFEKARRTNSGVKVFPIKAPGMATSREVLLNDIAAKLGAKRFINGTDSLIDMQVTDLGSCEKFVYKDSTATFYNPSENKERVEILLKQVLNKEEKASLVEDYEFLRKRKQVLNGKYAIFKVGGYTVAEQGAKKALIQDALRNVTSSLEDGIVPGGGTTLVRLSNALLTSKNANNDAVKVFARAVSKPFQHIISNFNSTIADDELRAMIGFVVSGDKSGFNFNKGEKEMQTDNIVASGVVDPYKGVEQSILTALSIAMQVAIIKNIFIEVG